MRSLIAILAAAFIGLAFVSDSASARPMGGGFRGGGFHGGFHGGGFRHGGFHGGFRHGGFHHHGFRGGFPFVGAAVGLGLAAASYPYWGGYGYGGGCLVRERIWTPYGWRVRVVDVCY
jgi:hypothetical protein